MLNGDDLRNVGSYPPECLN